VNGKTGTRNGPSKNLRLIQSSARLPGQKNLKGQIWPKAVSKRPNKDQIFEKFVK